MRPCSINSSISSHRPPAHSRSSACARSPPARAPSRPKCPTPSRSPRIGREDHRDQAVAVLTDHVRHVTIAGHRHELHRTEPEVVRRPSPIPRPERNLRLRPTTRDRDHKPLAPAASIVADVSDDLRTRARRGGRISCQPGGCVGVLRLVGRGILTEPNPDCLLCPSWKLVPSPASPPQGPSGRPR